MSTQPSIALPVLSLIRRSYAVRVIAGFLIAAAALGVTGSIVTGGYASAFDESIRNAVQYFASSWLTAAMRVVTRLGSTLVLSIVGFVAVVAFGLLRWWRAIGLFLLAMGGQIILHLGFKAIFARGRPEAVLDYVVGDSYSFPSGHAIASACVYGTLAWLFTRRLKSPRLNAAIWLLAVTLVFLIGFSRVYFGVHHASDVIAGYLAAFIWTAAVAFADPPVAEGDKHKTSEANVTPGMPPTPSRP